MDKHIAEYEEKLAASQTPLEEAKNRAILGDFYRIKGQTLLASRPEQKKQWAGLKIPPKCISILWQIFQMSMKTTNLSGTKLL